VHYDRKVGASNIKKYEGDIKQSLIIICTVQNFFLFTIKRQNKVLIPGFLNSSAALVASKLRNLTVNLCVNVSGTRKKIITLLLNK